MAAYGPQAVERCRFCGLDLPPDAIAVMTHINTHWRQFNLDSLSLSPCAFEPQLDIRVGATPLNPEDMEVSSHMEQGFQYTYSPQTEPSNLTVNGSRCSPLNLTGRPRASSPSSSPLPSTVSSHSHPHDGDSVGIQATHPNHNFSMEIVNQTNGLLPSVSSMQVAHENHALNMGIHLESHQEELLANRKKRNKLIELRCMTCGRTFFTKASFDEHVECHIKDNNSYMMIDQIDSSQTVQNIIFPGPDKPYKCAICDREFTYKEELQEHSESHESLKPYKCDVCGAGLSHLSALRRHRLAHTGYKPHCCEVCGRSFLQKCDLQRHYATHGKSKQYECAACKKKYSSLHFLDNHKCKPPEEAKPFKCNICGEGCANNMAWSYHMWKHTKNPIFVPCQEKIVNSGVLVESSYASVQH